MGAMNQRREAAPVAEAIAEAHQTIRGAGFSRIDYIALVDATTLEPVEAPAGEMRLIAAAMLGKTRLIDNIRVVMDTVRD